MTDVVPSDPRCYYCMNFFDHNKVQHERAIDIKGASAHGTSPTAQGQQADNLDAEGALREEILAIIKDEHVNRIDLTPKEEYHYVKGRQADELLHLYQVAGNDLVKKYPKTLERLANPPSDTERHEASTERANPTIDETLIGFGQLYQPHQYYEKLGDKGAVAGLLENAREAIRQTLVSALHMSSTNSEYTRGFSDAVDTLNKLLS